jgi:hypothetical protein
MRVSGNFRYGWDGFASLHGYLDVGFLGKKFNAEGGVKACLDFIDFCRGVEALISSKGIAVCMEIDLWLDEWHPGFGYKWGDSLPTPYFSGCSLGPYRESLGHASAVGDRTVTLPAGLPGAVIVATGADGPPKITLVGPKGERVSTPDDNHVVEDRNFFLMKNPPAKLTQVAIRKPSAGDWKVIVEGGTLTSLKVANGIEAPKITARVLGRGHDRRLRYAVEQRAGRHLTFVERGASASSLIGAAAKARGELPFHPAGGVAERRDIVAIVEQDGMVSEQPVVARYRAPAVRKPARVRGIRVARAAHALTVRWTGRGRHVVNVALGDGRKVVRMVRGRKLVVRVDRSVRARVTVRAVSQDGVVGR